MLADDEFVIAYHERTKHHYHRFAAALGYLDWDTQPDPFRRYAGAELIVLPLPRTGRLLEYHQLYLPGEVARTPLDLDAVSLFLRYSLSITAWKQISTARWSLRANPSSGNLHPTEGYVVLPAMPGVDAGVYHYAPREHALERRVASDVTAALPPGTFVVGLSSVHWREAWKYGERAFRYCQHDVGHAIGALRLAAAALGWRLTLQDALTDATVAATLGVDRAQDFGAAEREEAELLALVATDTAAAATSVADIVTRIEQLAGALARAPWRGQANRLSGEHVADWQVIDAVAERSRKRQRGAGAAEDFDGFAPATTLHSPPVQKSAFSAEHVILRRRSAVAMDARTSISRATFLRMMARVMPARDNAQVPWDAIPWRPRIHLGLFVHRVDGLPPGLYMLVRDPAKLDLLRAAMASRFAWRHVDGCPAGLPLYLLEEHDCRKAAASVSCGQDIAADGAFSLGMFAEFSAAVIDYGPWFYRRLFWETGLIGQVLYLEAEAAGVGATGIGCYFDDPAGAMFGLKGVEVQSFYHFTVGGPVEDRRLTTLPGYPEREAAGDVALTEP